MADMLKPRTLKEALSGKLSRKELALCTRAYDIIGDIAIIEIPKGFEKKEKLIAETILHMHKNIKTVCKKAGAHIGRHRTQKLKVIAGKKKKETLYKENKIRIKLNVEKVYFSPRLSTERKRIANLVRKGEKVLVMFSGCAPYPLVISKNSRAKEILGVEINPTAHRYAEENIKLNKANNIKLYRGDAKKIVPKLKERFDRIVMPLPRGAESYLYLALNKIKKGGIIHLYDFLISDEIDSVKEKVVKICAANKKKCKIIRVIKCGQYAPRAYRICVDLKVI